MSKLIEYEDMGPRAAMKEKPLLEGVGKLRLAYYGESGANRRLEWRDDWVGRTTLPKLVRIDVEFPPGDPRVWPRQTIATRVDVDATCILDLLTKNCRGR